MPSYHLGPSAGTTQNKAQDLPTSPCVVHLILPLSLPSIPRPGPKGLALLVLTLELPRLGSEFILQPFLLLALFGNHVLGWSGLGTPPYQDPGQPGPSSELLDNLKLLSFLSRAFHWGSKLPISLLSLDLLASKGPTPFFPLVQQDKVATFHKEL